MMKNILLFSVLVVQLGTANFSWAGIFTQTKQQKLQKYSNTIKTNTAKLNESNEQVNQHTVMARASTQKANDHKVQEKQSLALEDQHSKLATSFYTKASAAEKAGDKKLSNSHYAAGEAHDAEANAYGKEADYHNAKTGIHTETAAFHSRLVNSYQAKSDQYNNNINNATAKQSITQSEINAGMGDGVRSKEYYQVAATQAGQRTNSYIQGNKQSNYNSLANNPNTPSISQPINNNSGSTGQ